MAEAATRHEAIVAANKAYAESIPLSVTTLKEEAAGRLVVVTCMDHRINVFAALGLKPDYAYIIRNAGASAVEALRSIVVSQQLLNTDRIMVVKHTKCGMEELQNENVWDRVRNNQNGAEDRTQYLGFLNMVKEVRNDVAFLNASVLISKKSKENVIRGYVYHVNGDTGCKAGCLQQIVPETSCECSKK